MISKGDIIDYPFYIIFCIIIFLRPNRYLGLGPIDVLHCETYLSYPSPPTAQRPPPPSNQGHHLLSSQVGGPGPAQRSAATISFNSRSVGLVSPYSHILTILRIEWMGITPRAEVSLTSPRGGSFASSSPRVTSRSVEGTTRSSRRYRSSTFDACRRMR